jgi:hypothetical protein
MTLDRHILVLYKNFELIEEFSMKPYTVKDQMGREQPTIIQDIA